MCDGIRVILCIHTERTCGGLCHSRSSGGHSTVVVPHHSIPPAYQKEIETIAKQYVERNKDISLIVVYQFVPSGMNGFKVGMQ